MDVTNLMSNLCIKDEKAKTGIVFDDRMLEHKNLWDSNHIERPERYSNSLQKCKEYGLIDKCEIIKSRFAEENELQLIHDKSYIETIKNTRNIHSISELEKLASNYDSVYFHPKTYDSALLSTGSVLELVSSVLKGKIGNGMALVRPPGHHAMVQEACGFCYFNNVAIAAKYALKHFNLKRILIIDWDVHHGQATQQAFFNDRRVLYFSIHRYEDGNFWPKLRESNFDAVGGPQAQGFNINVPLSATKLGNSEYLAIFNNILLPVAYEFCPELVLISAGYDAALGCPEGEMNVTPHAYAHLLHLVSNLANGRVCAILEGGYCLTSLSESLAMTLRTLLGNPCPMICPTNGIHQSAVETILNILSVQRPFWESLRVQDSYGIKNLENGQNKNQHLVHTKFVGNTTKATTYPTREDYPVQDPDHIIMHENHLKRLIEETDLSVSEHVTGFVFDAGMLEHMNKREKKHPEKAERVLKIYETLENYGLLSKCHILESRKATKSELMLAHDLEYIEKMESTKQMSDRNIAKMESGYESIYLCQATFESAVIACGSLLGTIDAVVDKKCSNGFALIRPPGHHAEQGEACGFCIFNSVAIAAKYLISKYNKQKVLIIDWDIHHGNGIQHIFYEDDRVLYISLHLYNGDFFPGLKEASYESVGKGKGEGFNINIPWSTTARDGDYLSAFFNIILPIAYEFGPEFVLVSAGFDAVKGDPLGSFQLTPQCFGIMTKFLCGLANGKIVLALEGGYNVKATSEAAAYCVRSLLGENVSLPKSVTPSYSAIKTIQDVIGTQKKFWKCLQFDVDVPDHGFSPFEYDYLAKDENSANKERLVNNDNEQSNPNPKINLSLCCGGAEGTSTEGLTLFCVTPREDCPHLELLAPLPNEDLNPFAACQVCQDLQENWVCLHCYQVYCGRYVNEHMLMHGVEMQHFLTLSYADLSVWCYGCESYIHNQVLMPIKQHVHFQKFGISM